MFSEKATHLIRNKTVTLSLALSAVLFCPRVLHASEERSYAQEIEQDIAEDKVYLLENIRQKVTIPSEKTLMEALLSEDGPQAIALYRKQLREYPDPLLDKLSSSRIAAYTVAFDSSVPIPKHLASASPSLVAKGDSTNSSSRHRTNEHQPSLLKRRLNAPQPSSEELKQEKVVAGPTTSTLQFGSFESQRNAQILAKKIFRYAPVEIIRKGQIYKVQLKKNYASKEDAAADAKKMPIKAIVVPSI